MFVLHYVFVLKDTLVLSKYKGNDAHIVESQENIQFLFRKIDLEFILIVLGVVYIMHIFYHLKIV